MNAVTFENIVNQVMNRYSGISLYVPDDLVAYQGGNDFSWIWAPQNVIQTLGGTTRSGIAAAGTNNDEDVPDHGCRIKGSFIALAVDPNEGPGLNYCWGDVDTGICAAGVGIVDFESAALHEYGHALGLDHSTEPNAVMGASLNAGEAKRSLLECEETFLASRYRENFGPSNLSAFEVSPTAPGEATCTWTSSVESGSRAFRLARTCPDGTVTMLADSVFCQGAGSTYSVADSIPCSGIVEYVLSVVDSTSQGGYEEKVVVHRKFDAGQASPLAIEHLPLSSEIGEAEVGFGTAEEAVAALGMAISGRDNELRRRTLADGFGYYTKAGEYWGRAIDGILEESLRACLAGSESAIDSLCFEPTSSQLLAPGLVEVNALSRYWHTCGGLDVTWTGQIRAIVERRFDADGWRVRQIVEVQ